MENTQQVFDLREFLIMLLKKGKLFIAFALVFAVLGGLFGFITVKDDLFVGTSSASVNTKNEKTTDATALTSIMTSIKDTVNGDFFYTGVLEAIRADMDENEFSILFGNSKQPSIADLKTVLKFYVNGNLVLVDVTGHKDLVLEASKIARKYAVEKLSTNINNITISEQGEQIINKSLQTGDTARSRGIKFAVLGFAGGIVLAALWLFFFDVMSILVKDCDDLKRFKLAVFPFEKGIDNSVEVKKVAASVVSTLTKGADSINGIIIGVSSSATGKLADAKTFSQKLCDVLADGELSCVIKSTKGDSMQNAKAFAAACRDTANITIMPLEPVATSIEAMNIAACCDGVLLVERRALSRTDEIEEAIDSILSLSSSAVGICLFK